eukprot:12687713-Ditylum_brightwellii.AAC.2
MSCFFQVGVNRKETEAYTMCVPALASLAPQFVKHTGHYVAAYLTELGGESYIDRILMPEAVIETNQYKYCLQNHTLKPIQDDLIIQVTSSLHLKEFEHVETKLDSGVIILPNPDRVHELGSQASRHAKAKSAKKMAKSALSPNAKYSDISSRAKNQPPEDKGEMNKEKEVKPKQRLKSALKLFVSSKLKTSTLLNSIQEFDLRATVAGLFDPKKKTNLHSHKKIQIAMLIKQFCHTVGVSMAAPKMVTTDDQTVDSAMMELTSGKTMTA